MKKNNLIEISVWILAFLPLLLTVIVYPALPQQIPMHWNFRGEIDGWGTRGSAFLMPVVTILLTAMLKWMPNIDPKKENYKRFGNAYGMIRLIFGIFMLVVTGVTLFAAFNPQGLPINSIIIASVGGLFCVIGNFMPQFKHNYFVGIKTPWTLASEEVWARTHRLAGPFWFFGGLGIVGLSFFADYTFVNILMGVILLVITLVPMVYSYVISKK